MTEGGETASAKPVRLRTSLLRCLFFFLLLVAALRLIMTGPYWPDFFFMPRATFWFCLQMAVFFFGFLTAIGLALSAASLVVAALIARDKEACKRLLIASLNFLLVLGAFSLTPFLCRTNTQKVFLPVAKRGDVIVQAIEDFKKARSGYPESLTELVPEFLPKIPSTGLAGYPQFEYGKGPKSYALSVDTSCPFQWDAFIYWPEGDYASHYWGGRIERVDKWLYFHE